MIDNENIELLNLFVDESGTAALGINPYRFFLLTAVIMTQDQQEFACLLLEEWRKKYLRNPTKSVHMSDFFEDFEGNYKNPQLKIEKNFRGSIDSLLDILDHVKFEAQVYYVDLKKLRKKLGVKNPPDFKLAADFKTKEEKKAYYSNRKVFEKYLVTAHKGNLDKPYTLPLFDIFKYHDQLLTKGEKEDVFKRKFEGFINFESLSGADVKAVAYFHKFKEKVSVDYQYKIVGINFPTKNSLDGGIEIADIISYVSFQTLRFERKLHDELKTIPTARQKQLKRMREEMWAKKIKLVQVTDRTIPKKQNELT